MATVQFFRRLNNTVSDEEQGTMDSDSIYLTTYDCGSYLFYDGYSLASSPSDRNPFIARSQDNGLTYTITTYREIVYENGMQFLVYFDCASTTTTPKLNGTPIRRRVAGTVAQLEGGPTSDWLQSDTSYLLTYSTVGTQSYWIVEGKDKGSWYDLYGKPTGLAQIATSTSSTTTPTTLDSGKLYIIYDN